MNKALFAIAAMTVMGMAIIPAFAQVYSTIEWKENGIKQIMQSFQCRNAGEGHLVYAFYPKYVYVEMSKDGQPAGTTFSYKDFTYTIAPFYSKIINTPLEQC